MPIMFDPWQSIIAISFPTSDFSEWWTNVNFGSSALDPDSPPAMTDYTLTVEGDHTIEEMFTQDFNWTDGPTRLRNWAQQYRIKVDFSRGADRDPIKITLSATPPSVDPDSGKSFSGGFSITGIRADAPFGAELFVGVSGNSNAGTTNLAPDAQHPTGVILSGRGGTCIWKEGDAPRIGPPRGGEPLS